MSNLDPAGGTGPDRVHRSGDDTVMPPRHQPERGGRGLAVLERHRGVEQQPEVARVSSSWRP